MRSLRVIYMGTPEFAVSPLEEIIKSEHKVIGVVTTQDKPAGRGQRLTESAVKKYAIEHNLPLLQPAKMRDLDFIAQLKELKPDVMVIVAFRLLPKEVWSIPVLGTFNLHASLLPQYRGASPINFAIINGDRESGVTTFFIDDKIDTGEILLQEKVDILPEDDAGSLHDKLKEIGRKLVVKTLNGLAIGDLKPKAQILKEGIEYKYAPKIFKEDCRINWESSLEIIHNLIRGLSPYPVAFTQMEINGEWKNLKIYEGRYILEPYSTNDENRVLIEGKIMKIATREGYYFPEKVQLEGKKRMSIVDFINGLGTKVELKVK